MAWGKQRQIAAIGELDLAPSFAEPPCIIACSLGDVGKSVVEQ